jgi:hypothetical protein
MGRTQKDSREDYIVHTVSGLVWCRVEVESPTEQRHKMYQRVSWSKKHGKASTNPTQHSNQMRIRCVSDTRISSSSSSPSYFVYTGRSLDEYERTTKGILGTGYFVQQHDHLPVCGCGRVTRQRRPYAPGLQHSTLLDSVCNQNYKKSIRDGYLLVDC